MTNRKKVRGWKTQIRRVERWRERHLTPDWTHFGRFDFDYVKIQIDPWNRLVRRQPPLWLGRQMIHGLLNIYDAWAEAAPDAPYLRIWLAWPFLMDSQVVMAGESQAGRYGGMFRSVSELGWASTRGFPPQFGALLLERLRAYQWQECLNEYEVDAEDVSPRWLAKRPHSTLIPEGGRPVTWVEQGRIWVGQRRLTGGV
ncbi:hypothetical protein [Deinococcus phoenicis]|uniref:hypothetical protein n=1 Tax=Deinococcus phoenicis TaxID=1476583 RepID=UPI0012692B19|nr:hypothetical protein [Deinococcus phoenicis]